MPAAFPGNSTTKLARSDGAGGFESAISNATELSNGQSITISGTGFGAVANPNPSAYDDFSEYDGLVAGDPVPVATASAPGALWNETGEQAVFLDDTVRLPGRPFSAGNNEVNCVLDSILSRAGGPPRSINSFYMSGWMYFNIPPNATDANHPNLPVSFKFTRIGAGTVAVGDPRESHLFRNATPGENPVVTDSYAPWAYWPDTFTVPNTFVRYEYEIYDAVYNAAEDYYQAKATVRVDGKSVTFENGSLVFDPPYERDANLYKADGAAEFSPIELSTFGSSANIPERVDPAFRMNFMEIHEAPTRARVEFSNNPTLDYSVNQRRFYQRCSTRTDSSVVIPSVFLGDLDTSIPIYAHIIKADNSVVTTELVVGNNVEIN